MIDFAEMLEAHSAGACLLIDAPGHAARSRECGGKCRRSWSPRGHSWNGIDGGFVRRNWWAGHPAGQHVTQRGAFTTDEIVNASAAPFPKYESVWSSFTSRKQLHSSMSHARRNNDFYSHNFLSKAWHPAASAHRGKRSKHPAPLPPRKRSDVSCGLHGDSFVWYWLPVEGLKKLYLGHSSHAIDGRGFFGLQGHWLEIRTELREFFNT